MLFLHLQSWINLFIRAEKFISSLLRRSPLKLKMTLFSMLKNAMKTTTITKRQDKAIIRKKRNRF
jgi:hypothetical protein